MVLRLDPALPLLWRSPRAVQLGSPAAVVLDDVTPAEERLLEALRQGVAPSGLEMLADSLGFGRTRLARLLDRLGPVLETPPEPASACMLGSSPLASALAAVLDPVPGGERPGLVVLVADWVLEPEDHGVWLRRDVPHVPVVVSGREVAVGPFVIPGIAPCLHCVHRARTDADPAWPAIESQLWGRDPARLDPVARGEALALVVRRLADWRHGEVASGQAWSLDTATGRVSGTRWAPHPECLCAARPGSDWARGADPGSPPATTTARAAAALA